MKDKMEWTIKDVNINWTCMILAGFIVSTIPNALIPYIIGCFFGLVSGYAVAKVSNEPN